MFALIEIILTDVATLAPEFAMMVGAADLKLLRRRRRVTVRTRGSAQIIPI